MSVDLKRIQKSELSSVLRDFWVNTHSERGEMKSAATIMESRKNRSIALSNVTPLQPQRNNAQMQMARKRPREIDGDIYH